MPIKVKLLREGARLPERANVTDAGADLFVHVDSPDGGVLVYGGETKKVCTGIAIAIDALSFGLVTTRSSARLAGWDVQGVIDPGYRGEVHLLVRNDTREPMILLNGQRIAQLIIIPCSVQRFEAVDDLGNPTQRGERGFGSSGV